MAKQRNQTTESVPASVAAPKNAIDGDSGAQPEAPTGSVKVEGAASAPPSTDVPPLDPPPAATAVAAAPPPTLDDVKAAEEELAREKEQLAQAKADAIADRDEMLAEFERMLVMIETGPVPSHLTREEVFDELMRLAAETEKEMISFAAEADPVILERMATISQRIRRRASDFGPPPPAAQRFRALAPVRYALNGTIHMLAKDSIVSDATHDMEALRSANAQLEEVAGS